MIFLFEDLVAQYNLDSFLQFPLTVGEKLQSQFLKKCALISLTSLPFVRAKKGSLKEAIPVTHDNF